MATIRHRKHVTDLPWQAQIRLSGFDPESASFRTEKQARQWSSQREAELKAGLASPKSKDIRILATVKFREILREFKEARELKDSYAAGYVHFMRDPIADTRLNCVTRKAAMEWRNRAQDRLKPQSVSKYARVARGAWKHASDVLELPVHDNPFNKLGLKDVKAKRWRRVSKEEMDLLIEGCSTFKKGVRQGGMSATDFKDIITFAVETGLRRGEITGVHMSHIRNGNLWVPAAKTDRPREVPLTAIAAKIIEDRGLRGFSGLVFPFQSRTITRDFTSLARKQGVNNLHFHDLRHEALSRFNDLGLSTFELMVVSGHKSPEHLAVYVNPTLKAIQAKIRP